mmetsp:Transcript_169/g.423  ORF Transcript_169/g.423 Transcript_169/m.423 type:complete len:541 (-) Transcript_169:149-1771(-)|eukprot:CAMPEP_0194319546 /NCGR_PEP_ID=MMETSP0171-20130528/15978_1 /TAXON_ID=218684 /ORGANISM="Corethron pennatum, Strain L29A3" /LENGTH=540 /DNA_ID=CAMNT_0039076787 /DNA_START=124 /DNA_END=1746 /DNA_ORIENTATION=+
MSPTNTIANPKATSTAAWITFFKSLFGAGLLSLPTVFGEVGLALGSVVYILVTLGCTLTCYLLLESRTIAESPEIFGLKHRCLKSEQKGLADGLLLVRRNPPESLRYGSIPAEATALTAGTFEISNNNLVTYGDLADALLNPFMANIIRWTIIILHILFTSGLIIVIEENMYSYSTLFSRHSLGFFLLPVISALLQFPMLQDLYILSFLGLIIYGGGVIGSTVYSAFLHMKYTDVAYNTEEIGESFGQHAAEPIELWNWSGLSTFLGSAVYALEGINLALPTVSSMQQRQHGTVVVCSALLLYGFFTLFFAIVGYIGGVGGSECDVVTQCITPMGLRHGIQLSLSLAMLVSIPIMLYPSTEMLEVMLSDYIQVRKEKGNSENYKPDPTNERFCSDIPSTNVDGDCISSCQTTIAQNHHNPTIYNGSEDPTKDAIPSTNSLQEHRHKKSTKLRLFLALLTTILGTITPSFKLFSSFVGAVGLTFAGFILPPILYISAMQKSGRTIRWYMKVACALLFLFGFWNMFYGGFTSGRILWDNFTT